MEDCSGRVVGCQSSGALNAGAIQDHLPEDGPNNEVPIGRRSISFKHARPKAMAGLEGKFALVVQALRYLGKEGVGESEIETLREALSAAEKRKLVKDTQFGVGWIYAVAKKIAEKTT